MATIEPLMCYITIYDEEVVISFIINTRSGMALVAVDPDNESINAITISDVCLDFLCSRLNIDRDKIFKTFGSLKLPERCYVTPYDDCHAIAIKSKNIETIFETIRYIGNWWFESINKLKEIEFPYRILINVVEVYREIKFKE